MYSDSARSELLRQWGCQQNGDAKFRLLSESDDTPTVAYGPYTRKGKVHASTTCRGCLCESEKLLCPHMWTLAFEELGVSSAEGMNSHEFTKKLQLSVAAALPAGDVGDVSSWTSHVFRRGSAVDILQAHGVRAMLKHGEWASETSSHAYATADEIDTQKLRASCVSMVDLSDDDV